MKQIRRITALVLTVVLFLCSGFTQAETEMIHAESESDYSAESNESESVIQPSEYENQIECELSDPEEITASDSMDDADTFEVTAPEPGQDAMEHAVILSEGVYLAGEDVTFAEGDTVSLILFLNKNVLPRELDLLDEKGNRISFTSDDGLLHISFVMPDTDVTAFASFSEMTEAEAKALHEGESLPRENPGTAMITAVKSMWDNALRLFSLTAQAAPGGSGYYSQGAQIYYSSAGLGSGNWTSEFNINSNGHDYFGFCVNPSLYAPVNGTYGIEDLSGNERLRKVLFYGYKGQVGGILESIGVTSPAAQNVITHTALAQAYGDAHWSSGLNASGIYLTNRYLQLVDSLTAPTVDQQKVYRLVTPNSRQTIVFGEGKLLGSIWILKNGMVTDDNGSYIEYSQTTDTYVGGRKIQDNPNYNNRQAQGGNYSGAQFTVFKDTGLLAAGVINPKASDVPYYEALGLLQFVWFTAETDGSGSTIFGPVDADTDYWLLESKAPSGFAVNENLVAVHAYPYTPSDIFPFGLSFAPVYDEAKYTKILIQKEDGSGNGISCNPGQGAQFGLYVSEADALADNNRLATAESDLNGDALFDRNLLMGETYYVRELRAPVDVNGKRYTLLTSPIRVVTANSDDPNAPFGYTCVPVSNTEEVGYLTLEKQSANPELTNGNSCYNMNGITYRAYASAADARSGSNPVGDPLVISGYNSADSKGSSNTIALSPGTYWIKEVDDAARKSSGFTLDSEPHEVTVTSSSTTTAPVVLSVSDGVNGDPVSVLLEKTDKFGNSAF